MQISDKKLIMSAKNFNFDHEFPQSGRFLA